MFLGVSSVVRPDEVKDYSDEKTNTNITFLMFLRTFVLIVFAHPYCARKSCCNVTPRHASSAHAEKTFQTNIGLVAVAITLLAVYSLKWSVTPIFFDRQLCFAIPDRFNDCKKMNKKSMWEVYKFLIFLPTRHQILPIFQLPGECKCDH